MRDTLTDPSLARYARRFVWLELDFDKPENRDFVVRHAVANTPSLFILDPVDEHVAATKISAMTLFELKEFLERGEREVLAGDKSPADAALGRGDELLAGNQHAQAAAAYQDALRLAPPTWPQRDLAIASLAWALKSNRQWQSCAEIAAAEAPHLARTSMLGRVVLPGMWCVNMGEPAPWSEAAAKVLEPLAEEAVLLPSTARDHRFQLYQNLMYLADAHGDHASVAKWGDRWLRELNATKPANDDERSALDIARVDVESILGDPSRVLPALIASERAMPNNYNASLRVAQMQIEAKHYDEAIAACDRGLKHVTGPMGRTWLLKTKADALIHKGQPTEAQRVLEEALRSAKAIAPESPRKNNIAKITKAIGQLKDSASERKKVQRKNSQ